MSSSRGSTPGQWEVFNCGEGGENSTYGLGRLPALLERIRPTHVLIYYGTNDALNELRFVAPEKFAENLVKMFRLVRAAGAEPVVCTVHPCDPAALFTRHDPKHYAPDGPNARIDLLNREIRLLAQRHQVALADFEEAVRTASDWRSKDGVHLTANGYRLLAQSFLEVLPAKSGAKRVLCLGDSLTLGAGVPGQGTATGYTYPAWLVQLSSAGPTVQAKSDPVREQLARWSGKPPFRQTESERVILNSEYLVPMGTPKPVIIEAESKPGTLPVVDFWWSAAGAKMAGGGWEAALWWLRDLERVTLRFKVSQLYGDPIIMIRLFEREAGVGFNNDLWSKSLRLADSSGAGDSWREVVLEPTTMKFLAAGEGTPQWELINYLTVEVQGAGDSSVQLQIESPQLWLKDGRALALWDPQRNFAQFDAATPAGRIPPPRGRYLIGKGGSVLGGMEGRAALLTLQKHIPNLGLAANQGMRYLSENAAWLEKHDIGVTYQQGGVSGLAEPISRAKGWLASPDGFSRNDRPGAFGMVGMFKYYDMTSPALRQAFDEVFRLTAAGGVPEFQIIESYWPGPWAGGFWGGAEELPRVRQSLLGKDEGFLWEGSRGSLRMRFWDYFHFNNGFLLRPEDTGFKSWDEFVPPRHRQLAQATTETDRRHFFLMMNLIRYHALKYYHDIGLISNRRGVGLAMVMNRENYDNSFDLLGLGSIHGLGAVGHEYFGNPRHYLESAFEQGPVLRAWMDSTKKDLRGVLETNATGAVGHPYYDPQVAYATAYAALGGDRPDSVENDWLSWYHRDLAGQGATVERDRFADFVVKGMAYAHVQADDLRASQRDNPFVVLRSRQINVMGIMPASLLGVLREEGLPRVRLEPTEARLWNSAVVASARVMVDDLATHTPEDLAWMEQWLDAVPGRTLVAYGWRLGKRPDGVNFVLSDTKRFSRMNTQDGYKKFLGGEVREMSLAIHGQVTSAWTGQDAGSLALDTYYQGGKRLRALVTVSGRSVVSAAVRKNGSRVIYLHYEPSPATRKLDAMVLTQVGREAGIIPEIEGAQGLISHTFDSKEGKVVAAFAEDWLKAFHFTYDPHVKQRLKWDWPESAHTLTLRRPGKTETFAVDLLTGELRAYPAGDDPIRLALAGKGCGLWTVTTDRAAAERLADRARQLQTFFDHSFTVEKP